MTILCSLKHLSLAFGTKVLFNNTNLTIEEGDQIGLLGLNGFGKSTLLKILNETVIPDSSTPAFQFDKTKGQEQSARPFSIFYVPQAFETPKPQYNTIKNYLYHFYPQFQTFLENDQFEEIEAQGGWQIIDRYESYLKYFGLIDWTREVASLSGGEQKKILLSLGLSSTASLILWDEPTNHLDLETIQIFEEQMAQSVKTFILVSHDRYLLAKLTKKIFHLNRGEIKAFNGGYTRYLEYLNEQETQRQITLERLNNRLRRETAWMRQGVKARGTRSKKRVENFVQLSQTVGQIKAQAKKELDAQIHASQRKTKKLITIENGSFSFENTPLFTSVDLQICKGDKIGLLGRNGEGKTTLTHIIEGKLLWQTGHLKSAANLDIKSFSQKRDELDLASTPAQLIGEGSDFIDLPDGSRRHVSGYLKQFLFDPDDINRPLADFSGGEKNRLQMAFNLKHAADLWIFDEPTNDLDLETLAIIEQQLLDFKGALILISHDRSFLSAVTNKIWLIHDQTVEIFGGGYSQVEPYLEIMEIEAALKKEQKEEEKKMPANKSPLPLPLSPPALAADKKVKKPSFKSTFRLKELDALIVKEEAELIAIEDHLSDFDFGKMDETSRQTLHSLTQTKEALETSLMNYYEEKESLLKTD